MLARKQMTFDDMIAVAEWLVAHNYTSPAKLAIEGGSNGGLTVGAVITQRPDLFRAAICQVPLLDMVRFQKFLMQIFNGDVELIRYLQKAFGYSCTAKIHEHSLIILHGYGDNGKSTLVKTLLAALGVYACITPAETLLLRRHDGIPNDVARLNGIRFTCAITSLEFSLQQWQPLAPHLEEQLRHLAYRALPAGDGRHELRRGLHLGGGVRDGDRQADGVEHRQVGEVVADVGAVVEGEAPPLERLRQRRELLVRSHFDQLVDLHLFGPDLGRLGRPAAHQDHR